MAGEWLDHVLDFAKMVLVHTAALVAWYFTGDLDAGWLVVPLAYQLVSVVTFAGLTLVGLLRRASGATRGRERPVSWTRSALLLPVDYGVLCVCFALWFDPRLFAVVYAVLATVNAVVLVYLVVKWRRELQTPAAPASSNDQDPTEDARSRR